MALSKLETDIKVGPRLQLWPWLTSVRGAGGGGNGQDRQSQETEARVPRGHAMPCARRPRCSRPSPHALQVWEHLEGEQKHWKEHRAVRLRA